MKQNEGPREEWHSSSGGSCAKATVPKLCPGPAFLPFLAHLSDHKINNLQIPRMGWESKSPSPHQILACRIN